MIYNMRTIIALLVLTCSVFGHSKRFVSRRGNRGGYDEIPVLSVGKDSLNGINIANKIRRFFKSGGKMAKKTEPETNDFTKDDTANATFIGNEVTFIQIHVRQAHVICISGFHNGGASVSALRQSSCRGLGRWPRPSVSRISRQRVLRRQITRRPFK